MRIEEFSVKDKPQLRIGNEYRSSQISRLTKGDSPAKISHTVLCPTLEAPKLDLKLPLNKNTTPSLHQVSRNIVNMAMVIGS
jgi:hypothetical protein